MPNDMEHERHRWSYMSETKLTTRLRRIRDPIKLENFITLAHEHRNLRLLRLAAHRAHQLGHPYCERHAVSCITAVMRAQVRSREDPSRRPGGRRDTLYHWALEHHDDAEYEDVSRRDRDTDVSHGRFQWEVNCCRGCGNRVGPPTWYKDGGRWYYLCPECNKSYARADSLAEELENPKKIRKIIFRRRNGKTK